MCIFFDVLPAVSSIKVREKLCVDFFCLESDNPDKPTVTPGISWFNVVVMALVTKLTFVEAGWYWNL